MSSEGRTRATKSELGYSAARKLERRQPDAIEACPVRTETGNRHVFKAIVIFGQHQDAVGSLMPRRVHRERQCAGEYVRRRRPEHSRVSACDGLKHAKVTGVSA